MDRKKQQKATRYEPTQKQANSEARRTHLRLGEATRQGRNPTTSTRPYQLGHIQYQKDLDAY